MDNGACPNGRVTVDSDIGGMLILVIFPLAVLCSPPLKRRYPWEWTPRPVVSETRLSTAIHPNPIIIAGNHDWKIFQTTAESVEAAAHA